MKKHNINFTEDEILLMHKALSHPFINQMIDTLKNRQFFDVILKISNPDIDEFSDDDITLKYNKVVEKINIIDSIITNICDKGEIIIIEKNLSKFDGEGNQVN